MEDELGKQLLIRGTKGSRKVTLTEEGMILRKRAEEILQLVKKTEDEITLSLSLIHIYVQFYVHFVKAILPNPKTGKKPLIVTDGTPGMEEAV